jgi:hypothetical protein
MGQGISFPPMQEYTFAEGLGSFGTSLYAFTQQFFEFLLNMDLLHPAHLGFLLLLIFLGMGIRPSYVGEEKKQKIDMIYDLKNIKNLIIQKPLYMLLLFLLAYLFFYISFILQVSWYVAFFSILGWLSIISLVSLIITHMIIFLIKITDEIPGFWRFIPFLILPISYISIRIVFTFFESELKHSVSLLGMILSTIVAVLLLLRFKTNTFKTKVAMKSLKKVEDGSDEPRRLVKQ